MDTLQHILQIAGLAQIVLALGSLFVPEVLKWKVELSKVQPLIKQMFWTYAGYIFVINICFGLLSLFACGDISNGSNLATLVTGFIATYWISRVLVQFLYFDRSNFHTGYMHQIAEIILVVLFISLSVIYSWVAYMNFNTIR